MFITLHRTDGIRTYETLVSVTQIDYIENYNSITKIVFGAGCYIDVIESFEDVKKQITKEK